MSLVTATNPATAGETLVIYCTGLGAFKAPLKSGQPAPTPPPSTLMTPQLSIGGIVANLTQSSAAPGYAGVYQVLGQVPANSQTGSSVSVTLSAGAVTSNTVTIAVR
jgi:uncharacterized protein (TIGR03437 family)